MNILTLIQTLTSRKTSNHRTSPRRALRPSVDALESRVVLDGGAWGAPMMYTPSTQVGSPSTTPTQWLGTMTPQVMPPSTIV